MSESEPHEHDAAGCLECECWSGPPNSLPCTCSAKPSAPPDCWPVGTHRPETVSNIVVAALRDAAERLRTDAATAWGGDSAWLTTGTHVADLAAEWLDEDAAQIEARP